MVIADCGRPTVRPGDGLPDRFDFFLLSDTTDPDVWVEEEKPGTGLLLRKTLRAGSSTEADKQHQAEERNVADFCRVGQKLPYMAVFDADSINERRDPGAAGADHGARPDIGILQRLPSGGTGRRSSPGAAVRQPRLRPLLAAGSISGSSATPSTAAITPYPWSPS